VGANASVLLSAPSQPGFETFTTSSVETPTAQTVVPFSGPNRSVTYRRHTRPLYRRHHTSGSVGDVRAMPEPYPSFTPIPGPFGPAAMQPSDRPSQMPILEDDRPHPLGSLDETSLDIGDTSALPGDFTSRAHSQQADQHHGPM